jgi:outer membrane protein with beta-barrel domain
MVFKRVSCLMMVAALVWTSTVPALAQQARAEVSVLLGWSIADGVSGDAITTPEGIFDRIDPKDSFKWGLMGGVLLGEYGNAEVGFMWQQAMSKMEVGGTSTVEIGDWSINSYHGYFGYNFFENDAKVRPYILGGLGATSFGSVDYATPRRTGTIGGETQFSTTWGAGAKFYASPNVGARIGIQWTPTYIKSDAAGWWCDPWWGCYLVGDPQYSNAFDISGGVIFRF